MEAGFYGLHCLLRGESMEAILFIALSTKMAQNAAKVADEMGLNLQVETGYQSKAIEVVDGGN